MLSSDRVALPAHIEGRLKQSADFFDNVMDFAREDLIGFRRPIAATFAYTAPVVIAFAMIAGPQVFVQTVLAYAAVAVVSIYLVGREQWPALVDEFERRSVAKRKAIADLRCGFGEASFLNLAKSPRFIEHENGVLVFADIGDFKTLYFAVEKSDEDPRWNLYVNGELCRRVWRWLRLPVSREVVKFTTEASKIELSRRVTPFIDSVDVWDTVHAALGQPMDGAIIHRPFEEIVDSVERLVR